MSSSIHINGRSYSGNNITIKNGRVIIDGSDVTPDEKHITITVNGNIYELNVGACERISVSGNVGKLSSVSGNVDVAGSVGGNVGTVSGDIECGDVSGDASTTSGDISCNTLIGNATSMSGDIKTKKR